MNYELIGEVFAWVLITAFLICFTYGMYKTTTKTQKHCD